MSLWRSTWILKLLGQAAESSWSSPTLLKSSTATGPRERWSGPGRVAPVSASPLIVNINLGPDSLPEDGRVLDSALALPKDPVCVRADAKEIRQVGGTLAECW